MGLVVTTTLWAAARSLKEMVPSAEEGSPSTVTVSTT